MINYLASLHPKVILFDVVLDHLTPTDPEDPKAKPDDAAMAAYSAQKRLYAWQSVFAAPAADS